MSIQNTLLSTVIANVYVSSGNSAITTVYMCNTSGTAANFYLYAVPSGAPAINANVTIYQNVLLQSGDTYVIDSEKLILGSGDTLRANASANVSITTTVSYIGI